MDSQELTRRLIGITKGSPGAIITERTCWLDGEECPYGRPEGRFLLRPKVFCRPSLPSPLGGIQPGTGCGKIDGKLPEFDDLARKILGQELATVLRNQILKLSGEVEAAADADEKLEEPQKAVLKLAAELIRALEKQRNWCVVRIFRKDDLLEALEKELGITVEILD
ncbi:MAG: hypothetical protein AAB792_00655 [Patescibacteria group bacterium]